MSVPRSMNRELGIRSHAASSVRFAGNKHGGNTAAISEESSSSSFNNSSTTVGMQSR